MKMGVDVNLDGAVLVLVIYPHVVATYLHVIEIDPHST